ncbi:MAG: DNA polymerase III subunit beta [Ruminococcus sp.]|jgi:DNA polymerase-3 subunit beta|nr:DNA polymerase III subunit beta [Ruminococcus sp.]
MKFSVNQKILNEALGYVSKASADKSPLPVLEGIKFTVAPGELTLLGFDMEIGITTTIEADCTESVSFVLNARLICEIVRTLPNENVTFEIKKSDTITAKLIAGNVKASIAAMSAEDFPNIPDYKSNASFEIDGETFKEMINMTKFAVAQNDIKPILTGELFEIGGGVFKMVALDGYKLALSRENIDFQGKFKFVIKSKSLNECVSLIKTGTIKLFISEKNAAFEIGNYIVFTRLLEGEFHNYANAIPREENVTATVRIKTSPFLKSIERSQLFIDEKIKSPVRLNFSDNLVQLSCKTIKGEFYDEIECDVNGQELEIGFNGRYLADALKSAASDEVLLKLINGHSPMVVTPIEGDDFLYLVLPIRLH